jgi:nucleotide-binding universal stress UspA family protein
MIDVHRILCPIDFSPFSERALRCAMRLAVRHGAKLQVAHVMPLLPPSAVNALAAAGRQLSAKNLNAAIERCRIAGADVSAALIESASPAPRILEAAEAFEADLIVTGSHGRTGYQRLFLGSVVETLLHKSPCPVLTIPSHLDARSDAPIGFSRIVCAVDFSYASLDALAQALSIAEEADAHLTVVHVLETPPEAEAECRDRLQALIPPHARDYCTIDVAVLEGGVSRQILQLAADRQAELIVMGVHGRNIFNLAFFGSNAKDIIRQAHCPVLTVPLSLRHGTLRVAS